MPAVLEVGGSPGGQRGPADDLASQAPIVSWAEANGITVTNDLIQ